MSSFLGKRQLKKYKSIYVHDAVYDDYNELTKRLNNSVDDFIALLKTDFETETVIQKYIPSWISGGEHSFLLLLILLILPRLINNDAKLKENAITGIFIRKSITPNIDATYEAKFNDIF